MSDPVAAAEDDATVHLAERAVHDWTATVSVTLQKESGRAAAAGGPIKEIDFWRARHLVRNIAALLMHAWSRDGLESCNIE